LDEQPIRESQAVYYGMISFMDHWIGQTLDKLEALNILDNTLIVFTSDHGHFIGHHGLVAKGPFHYEDMIRVPFIAAWPSHISGGQTEDAIQSLVDIAPTFADAATGSVPRFMQGESQIEAWTADAARSTRDHAIVENHHQDSAAVHLKTLVTDRYKMTIYRGRDWGELFDLKEDPEELHNRYDDADFASVRAGMYEKLAQVELEREPAPIPRISGA
jgi:uncharacterized sulfatase